MSGASVVVVEVVEASEVVVVVSVVVVEVVGHADVTAGVDE